jgi:hypothetical protein
MSEVLYLSVGGRRSLWWGFRRRTLHMHGVFKTSRSAPAVFMITASRAAQLPRD